MRSENILLAVSVAAVLPLLVDVLKTLVRFLAKPRKVLVLDKEGEVVLEMSPETVQHTDLKELERVHERIRTDDGITLRAA